MASIVRVCICGGKTDDLYQCYNLIFVNLIYITIYQLTGGNMYFNDLTFIEYLLCGFIIIYWLITWE